MPPKTFHVTIGNVTRDLPVMKLPSGISIIVFNSISDGEIILESARELSKKIPQDIDILVTPEAKSIPLAYELSKQLNVPYAVFRKTKKPYMGQALQDSVLTITTGKPQTLYVDEKDIQLIKNKKVLIFDDVVSTGATVEAMKKLINQAGGTVAQIAAVFTEGDQNKWKDAISLGHLPIFE